jgi:type II secretory ATPase GspE/PulE/Tfp pilus assembly ATPase PilB-like protein
MVFFKKEQNVKSGTNIGRQTERVTKLQQELQYNEKFRDVTNKINAAGNIDEILTELKYNILTLFDAEGITIYAVDPIENELYSKHIIDRGGKGVLEIRVPISTSSLAGYTAYSMRLINIKNVYDQDELNKIHPFLQFDSSWDAKSGYRTKQVLAAPICYEKRLFGVIQLVNKKSGPVFTEEDEKKLEKIAEVLGISFKNHSTMISSRFNYLLSENIISKEELARAMAIAKEQNRDVESVLIENFKIKKRDIGMSLGQFYGCRYLGYSDHIIIPRELVKDLNTQYLKRASWVPIASSRGKVTVLIDNPNHPKTIEIRRLLKAEEIEFNVGIKEDILRFIESLEREVKESDFSISDILAEMEVEDEDEDLDMVSPDVDENASTIVRLVNQIIIDAYEKGASDIHIEPSRTRKVTDIRYRVDGRCFKHLEIPYSSSRPLVSRIKIMSNLDIAERRLPQDGKIKFFYKQKPIELRVATLPTVGGEDVVMRILTTGEVMPLNALNLSERNYRQLIEIITRPYGVLLVVGPTGSGKTTTLHSCLGYINKPETKIWTAEDPVEITQYGLRQVEVKPKIGFNFARAMRAFLRADPDVIMVGEMRDHETASIGIEASLTGHLVLSTLHTNSAAETITRLIDIGLDPFNFADALLGVLAQRLVRTLCTKCRRKHHPSKEEFDDLVEAYGKDYFPELGIEYNDDLIIYRPVGCDHCNQTGYRGRTALHELLTGTDELKRLIQRRAPVEEIRRQAMKDGMRTLYQDGIAKIFKGFTDQKEVRSVCIR